MKTDIKNIKDRENYMTWLMEEIKTSSKGYTIQNLCFYYEELLEKRFN